MQIKCPHCTKVLSAPENADVAQGKCPHCGELVDLAEAERVGIGAGDVLGDFRVEKLVGRGGMATVYRGAQISLDRPVAVKVLAPQLAKRAHFVERFQREAKVLAQLSHHNIVSVLAVGANEDTNYLVMEYVEGESLRARLTRDGKIPFAEAASLIDGVAAGLEYAHNHDVLHRDIKPGNILITAEGVPKIVDFGIARLAGADEAAQQRLTLAQTQMGSAHYMAPEQMSDAATADHRTDIYALGVMFYEMLTGNLPIGRFAPASKCTPGVPAAVDRILHQALTASPDDRIQTAAQFRALVQRLSLIGQPTRVQGGAHARRRHPEPKKSPLPMVLGGVGLLVVAVIAFFALRGVEPKPQVKHPPPEPEVVAPVRPRVPKKQSATPLRVRPKPSTPKPVEKKTVPVSRPPVAPPPDEAGWVSLFDGKSLDGWQKVSRFPVPKKYGPGTSGEATLDAAKQCIFLEPGNPISGIHCKTALPTTDYEVELEATSGDGKAPMFRVVFLVGGAHCTLLVTGGERSRVGLDIVDGKGMADNGTAADVDIDPAKWTRVRFRVTDSKVAVWMNDQQVIEQSREGHDLDRSPYYRHVENLGLCARGSRPAFRNIRFRRLGEAPAPPAPPGPPVKPAGVSVFHGAVSRLPDGRVELRYDWSDEAQLRDWQTGAPDKRRIMPGGVRIEGGPNQSRDVGTSAPFVGDIDVTMKCRVVETHGGEACPSITICGEPGRAYGISLTSERQYVWRGERRYENAIKTAKGPFAKGEDHTVRVSREADRIRAWIDGRLTHDVTDASYAKGPVNLGSWNVTALFGDVRIVGSLDPAWLAANPEAQKQIDAIIAARKDAVENDPAKLYAKGVAALKPLWQRRSYADALAKARTLGDPGLIEDAEALAAFWGAVRAGAAKLKPGDSIRIRGTQGRVTKVEADTIHAKAGPVELGMKLTQLDDAAFAALAGKGRALTSGRDLLALALLEVHAKTPDRTKAMAALARAAEAGVDVSRRKALLAPPKRTATPPRPKPNPKPQPIELHVAVRVDGVSELVLTPGAMHWEHKSWAKPGSGITVNGKPITLLWQGGSNTGRPVPVASVPTKLAAYEARVEKMGGRGRVTLSEAPAGQVVIRFDDGAHGGADDYEARLVLIPRLRTRR